MEDFDYGERLSASHTQGQCRKQSKNLSVYKIKKGGTFMEEIKKNGFHVGPLRVVLNRRKKNDTVEEFC